MQNELIVRILLLFLILLAPGSSLHAGDFNELLFLNGQQIQPEDVSDENRSELRSKPIRFEKFCVDNPERLCVRWKMYLLGDEKENQLKLATEEAMAIWKAETGLDIDFDYQGRIESFSGNPEEYSDVDLIIAFNNLENISFLEYEISKNKKWVDDDIDREILGLNLALVAINSNLNPHIDCENDCLKENGFSSFSLRSALVFEIGRFLGLGPSALSSSLMFPIQKLDVFKNYSQLRHDDLATLRALYELESQDVGRVTGRVIDGVTKEAWVGAHLILLPAESVELFSTTRDQNLFKYSVFSKRDGRFGFLNVKPGSYVLLGESLDGTSLSPDLFDDFIKVFARRDTFEPDFYDGKDRESNQENLRYSPRAVFFAATLEVSNEMVCSGVEVITNDLSMSSEYQAATGSSSEILSEWNLEDLGLSQKFSEERKAFERRSVSCTITKSSSEIEMFWIGCFLFLLIILRVRCRYLQSERGHLVK